MNEDQVAVVFDISCKSTEEVNEVKSAEATAKPSVCWLNGIFYLLNTTVRT